MSKQAIRYESSFYTIAEVRIGHSYYRSGYCVDWEVQPTAETRHTLMQYGILFKSRPDGFVLFGKADQVSETVLFGSALILEFNMRLRNPYFLSFTELKMDTDQVLFFKNGQEKGHLLHPSETVDSGCSQEEPSDGGVIGRISLSLNGENGLFGSQNGLITEPSQVYNILFSARKARMRYVLAGIEKFSSSVEFSIAGLSERGVSIDFDSGHPRRLPSGLNALVITSVEPLYLEERPTLKNVLYSREKQGGAIPVPLKALPGGNPKDVRLESECAICEMYVNL